MNHLCLFSGIGGFALAAKWAGFETVGFCEIEPYCQSVLAKNFSGVPIHDDIRTFRGERFRGSIDLLTGGFPCQDISVAGKGEGIGGKRSGLWFEMLRVINECRPRFVLIENVPALKNRGSDIVLGGLEEAGYAAEAFVVGASDIGATHQRKRVWIVAHSKEAVFERTGNSWARRSGFADNGNASLAHSFAAEPRGLPFGEKKKVSSLAECGGNVAHDDGSRQLQQSGRQSEQRRRDSHLGENVADSAGNAGNERFELAFHGRTDGAEQAGIGSLPLYPPARNDYRGWAIVAGLDPTLMPSIEREVLHLADGVSAGLVRRRRRARAAQFKGLGNAVFPDCAYLFTQGIAHLIQGHLP